MIKELKVEKLNGRFDYEFKFYENLNIFAGGIGTGKTTLLKLMWFLTSGNLQRVIFEIPFQAISIETSKYSLSMEMKGNFDAVQLVWKFDGGKSETKESLELKRVKRGSLEYVMLKQEDAVRKLNKQTAEAMQSSLFFPTFRRIERHFGWEILGKPLSQLANELSVGNHKFIAAVSTHDIMALLTEKHTEISEGTNRDDEDYKTLCQRWSELTQYIKEIFSAYYDGIWISENLTFHFTDDENGTDIIPSANFSSGEKQLLGFLSHNAFSQVDTMFIDEPELSLHPDWQRLLISILKWQGTEKQFFLATHSMHIIAKFDPNVHHLLG